MTNQPRIPSQDRPGQPMLRPYLHNGKRRWKLCRVRSVLEDGRHCYVRDTRPRAGVAFDSPAHSQLVRIDELRNPNQIDTRQLERAL